MKSEPAAVAEGSDHLDALIGKAMVATSPDCVKVVALDGTVLFMTDRCREMLEMDQDEAFQGLPWTSLWPLEARKDVETAIIMASEGRIARFTGFRPTRRGTPKWWDVAVSPIRNAGGEIAQLLCVARDITEQKAFELSLADSEWRFRAIADNMAQLAWMADPSGKIFWLNKRWHDYTGTTLSNLEGDGWRHVHHPDYVDEVSARLAAAFKRREVWEDVVPLRGKDGHFRWFLTRARPVRDERDRVILWCTTHTDITEQRNLGQRLRQLARMIELSHEAILVWDFEDGVILWNNGCEELYGYRRGEALGSRSHELLSTHHPAGLEAFERRLLRDGEWSGELLQRAKDGTEVWVESRQELIRADGRHLVLETNRDITERRRADETRDLLVAELNHRVKNTLAIVQSLANQTARVETNIEEFVASFTRRVQSLAAAQSILSDAHWSGAGLRELVASQITMTAGSLARQQASLAGEDIFLPPQTALQLTLVLHELAANAVEHGALSACSGHVSITWAREPGSPPRLVLDWRESGGPPVSAPRAHGFGRRLIERTGHLPGFSSSLSFPSEGVYCRITTDLRDAPSATEGYFDPGRRMPSGRLTAKGSRPPWMAGRRILVAESDPLEALRIEEALNEAGYLVVGPARTSDAVAHYIEERAFDLAIVDVESPAFDGRAILAALASHDKPSIAVCSSLQKGALPGSCAQALTKPVPAALLVDAVKNMLQTA